LNTTTSNLIELSSPAPFLRRVEVEQLCRAALQHGYRAVGVPSSRVIEACHFAGDSQLKICCQVGFPFGAMDADVKRFEVESAIDSGAHEIEFVPSLARLKDAEYKNVLRELRDAAEATDERPIKIVIESALWTPAELAEIARVVLDSGAQFLTTSIASAPSIDEVLRLRELIGPDFGLKAAGLNNATQAEAFVAAGANALGLLAGK